MNVLPAVLYSLEVSVASVKQILLNFIEFVFDKGKKFLSM